MSGILFTLQLSQRIKNHVGNVLLQPADSVDCPPCLRFYGITTSEATAAAVSPAPPETSSARRSSLVKLAMEHYFNVKLVIFSVETFDHIMWLKYFSRGRRAGCEKFVVSCLKVAAACLLLLSRPGLTSRHRSSSLCLSFHSTVLYKFQ